MAEIDPGFGRELKKYGAFDFNACYNCGNCTAVCNLSTMADSFPRDMIRMSVLGLKTDIKSSLKPWLCYYCGDCTVHCPQDANPGELMMSLRRWLTAQYDWTKLSGILYKSLPFTIIVFILIALGIVIFGISENFNPEKIMNAGHIFEMAAIAAVFGIILIPNIIRMWSFTVLQHGNKVKPVSYVSGLGDLIVNMFTQKKTLTCDGAGFRWFEHLILVFGYLGLLVTTVVFDWFSSRNIIVIVLGYLESFIILFVTADFMLSRLKKNKELSRFSQPSDWLFIIWLSAMGITAFAVRLFIDTGLIENNLWIYILHLVILVQWALIIVPFGKWTHFLYRSFAVYFAKIKSL
jgi:ferredoxin